MSDASLPRLPETFEGYRIGALRRSAGALAVHAATDRLDLPVELHAARTAVLGEPAAKGFTALLRRAADVRHESLLSYVTGGLAGDLAFAVAKSVDAPGLDEVLARGGAIAEDRALSIGAAACGALAALERAGLRHGDLTPRRVLLPGRGQVLLGPIRLISVSAAPRNERYQSPEEARGGDGDVRSDLFALGLILAESLRGEPVLKGPVAACMKSLAEGRVPADGGAASASPRMRSLLLRLLAADPAGRFPNAAAAERAFRSGASEVPTASAPVAVPLPETASIRTAQPLSEEAPPQTAPIVFGSAAQEERPETAPIGLISAASVLAAARAAEPQAPVTRTPGRLYVTGRLGETMLEIVESVWIGQPEGHIDLVARADEFPEADLRVERRPEGDAISAVRGALRVNGTAAAGSRVLANADAFEAGKVRGRYEREARTALRAAPAGPPEGLARARAALAAAIVLAVVGGAMAWSRTTAPGDVKRAAFAARDQAKRDLDAAKSAAAQPAAGSRPADPAEDAARKAWSAAREWARANPADPKGLAERMRDVAAAHGATGYGAIAAAEAEDAERRVRAGGGAEFETVLAAAAQDAANGRLERALSALRTYAEERPGTVAAEQARTAAVRLEGELVARLEADLAHAANLYATGDPDGAIRRIARIMDYVPLAHRNRVIALRDDIVKNITPKKDPAAEGPVGPPPGPGTKPPGPRPPVPPGPTPGTGGGGGPPVQPEDPEKAADAAFRAARKLMDTGKDEEAIDAFLGFLRDHKDTKTGARYENEARGRVQSLAQGPAGVTRLFKGKVERLEKGKFRLTYDFEDAKQFDDFRDVEAFEAPPRSKWSVDDGQVRAGRGSGALVLDAKFLVEDLDVRMRVSPDRAHDLGAAILDASEPRRYYLFTLQNSFFTLGKGPGAKVFEENAIVLFGPGMWRDTPPGQLGFVRKTGSPEPQVRTMEWTELRAGKHGANATMKVGAAKPMTGSAYGDVKLEFQGMEPGMFVLGSSGVFDDFVVEGTPDPEWVSARWRAILSGL